jgi:heme/copper-type cytochrome/quinol oxidase subunit 3
MEPAPRLDVSGLPPIAFDAKMPTWWGNMLFMVIETTTMALLVVSYYYTRQNNLDWPPPLADAGHSGQSPLPGLAVATLNSLLLIASCLPMARADRAARRNDASEVRAGLLAGAAMGMIAIVLRFFEFPALKFRWDDNAYASLIWAIVFMHLLYIIAATLEAIVIVFWIFRYGMSETKAVDVTLTAQYWYWMVGLWVPLYASVYLAPRLL